MRIKTKDGRIDLPAITPQSAEMRLQDLGALQRETGWTMAKVDQMGHLEVVALQLMIFFTWRSNGRAISFEHAGSLLDEVDFVEEPGDVPEDEAEEPGGDPTSAPTGSGRGDDEATAPTDPR